jgi:hypothetical protein
MRVAALHDAIMQAYEKQFPDEEASETVSKEQVLAD